MSTDRPFPNNRRRWIRQTGLGMASLASLSTGMTTSLTSTPAWATLDAGRPAPDFTLRSGSGRHLRLAEHRGRVVMVNFWATWCGPCRVEMPHLEALHKGYSKAGFVLLGVSIDDDPQQAVAMAQRLGVSFEVLLDTDKAVSRRYDLRTMPSTVLIDRNGQVRHVHRGYREGYERTYEQQVRQLLKEI